MARDPNCVFCKIVAAEIPSFVVYEDDAVLGFLDVGPLAEGHLLLIPRLHVRGFRELPPELAAKLAAPLPRLARALAEISGSSGVNVLCNDGSTAGQVVPHVHIHLIPRRDGDGLGYRWNAGTYPPGRAETLAARFQEVLSRPR